MIFRLNTQCEDLEPQCSSDTVEVNSLVAPHPMMEKAKGQNSLSRPFSYSTVEPIGRRLMKTGAMLTGLMAILRKIIEGDRNYRILIQLLSIYRRYLFFCVIILCDKVQCVL